MLTTKNKQCSNVNDELTRSQQCNNDNISNDDSVMHANMWVEFFGGLV